MSRFMDDELDSSAPDNSSLESGSDEAGDGALVGVDGSSGRSSSLRSNLMLLGFVVVIAGGAMFVMRKYSAQSGVELTDVKIDYSFDPGSQHQIDHAEVMQSLQIMDNGIQVAVENIRPDPFRMVSKTPVEDTTTTQQIDPFADARREAELRLAAIQKEFDGLRLNSVITGSIPIARISGQAVRIGDVVGEHFTVREIRSRSVTLEADEEMYILAL